MCGGGEGQGKVRGSERGRRGCGTDGPPATTAVRVVITPMCRGSGENCVVAALVGVDVGRWWLPSP